MKNDKSAEVKAIFADMSAQEMPGLLVEACLNGDSKIQAGLYR